MGVSTHPWECFKELHEQVKYLVRRQELAEDIDAILETCTCEHRSLGSSMDIVFQCLQNAIEARVMFLRTFDEELKMRVFSNGVTAEMLQFQMPQLLSVPRPTHLKTVAFDWYVIPLDMSGENIGSFGLGFQTDTAPDEVIVFDLMKVASEELDNFFYSIQENRRKHEVIVEVQRGLSDKILRKAIDRAVKALGRSVPIQDLCLIYLEEEFENQPLMRYHIYRDFEKIYDSQDRPMPQLDALLHEIGKDILLPENRDIERIIPIDVTADSIRLADKTTGRTVGKLVIRPPEDVGFSIFSREILSVFVESLLARLVDFSRERNWLRQSFAPDITEELLSDGDYMENSLRPRRKDIAVLFADIGGFTKLCEQVLKDPERIVKFIDHWANEAVEAVFDEKGVLDKIIGDCIMALFGPPFYRNSPREIVEHALTAAIRLRAFTRDYVNRPENADVCESPLGQDFGVSIGINFCSAGIGLVGPNHSFTAFGSGVNNAARLQGVAMSNQIFICESAYKALGDYTSGGWKFDGPFSVQVKNVHDPLIYYRLGM
ncbi:MAG: adenylate/guanylate cyclase domain-containing protein [Candidatus Riflebacteria bacterium]|nr:adenylate/guanylate cyclase domain-containing protein [Candidatus Riflebacteria bacterium]